MQQKCQPDASGQTKASANSGIERDAISILIATGLHRPNWGDELEEMIGAEIKDHYRVLNHDARDDAQQQELGEIEFDFAGETRTVDTHIKRIRAKLDSTGLGWSIKTIYGVGYKFETE